MLTAADLAGFDLPALLSLGARLEAAALHQDRCRRQAARFEIPAGFVGTVQAIEEMDQHAAAIAEGARLASLVARFMADQNERRPAPVLRLVPKGEPAAIPAPQSARGVVAKLAGLFGGRAAEVA